MIPEPNTTPSLEAAIAQGNLERVRALLDAEPAALEERFEQNGGLSPLMWACRRREAEIVAELLRRGAAVDARNRRETNGEGNNFALWFAANGDASDAVAIARLLVASGADVMLVGEFGQTALHQAALWNNTETAAFLLESGADVNLRTTAGETPLMLAQKYGFAEVAQVLCAHGANLL